jgi:hypothetical protein
MLVFIGRKLRHLSLDFCFIFWVLRGYSAPLFVGRPEICPVQNGHGLGFLPIKNLFKRPRIRWMILEKINFNIKITNMLTRQNISQLITLYALVKTIE